MTHGYTHATRNLAFLSELHVELVDQSQMALVQFRAAFFAGILDIFSEEGCVNGGLRVDCLGKQVLMGDVLILLEVGVVACVQVDHESAQVVVNLLIHFVPHYVQDIEARKDGLG